MTRAPESGRRAARVDPPEVLTRVRWRALRGFLTMAVLGSAAVAGVQLGETAPATSPVQPPVAQAAPDTATTGAADARTNGRHGLDGGRPGRGVGR